LNDFVFGAAVDLGDEVVARLGRDGEAIHMFDGTGNNIAGPTCSADRDVEHGVHGWLSDFKRSRVRQRRYSSLGVP